ncbi:hypothetical protein J6590_096919 [Homalodisca vitripennis]|nr:hypothetical protein J6590_096919 [Homalodisca vitripennis]
MRVLGCGDVDVTKESTRRCGMMENNQPSVKSSKYTGSRVRPRASQKVGANILCPHKCSPSAAKTFTSLTLLIEHSST